MNITYDKDTDYTEVFFVSGEKNVGEEIAEDVMAFKSEESGEIIGYGFDSSEKLFAWDLPTKVKLAALLKIERAHLGLSQQDMMKRLADLNFRTYQRIEAGENTSLDALDELKKALPDTDFSRIVGPGSVDPWATLKESLALFSEDCFSEPRTQPEGERVSK